MLGGPTLTEVHFAHLQRQRSSPYKRLAGPNSIYLNLNNIVNPAIRLCALCLITQLFSFLNRVYKAGLTISLLSWFILVTFVNNVFMFYYYLIHPSHMLKLLPYTLFCLGM